MKIQYMGKEFDVLSKCNNEHKIPFDQVYQRTGNRNKATAVLLYNNVVNMVRYRKELTLGQIMLYFNLDYLYDIIVENNPDVLNMNLGYLQPCSFISDKRSKEQIIEQLIRDNDIASKSENYIITKYAYISRWYKDHYKNRHMV